LGDESPFGESRGGTPTGVRIPLDARPCQRHGTMMIASVGVPLPYFWLDFWFGEAGIANGEIEAPPLAFALLHPASRCT
jgi:hypothetical protein